jgi:hypothetical protein
MLKQYLFKIWLWIGEKYFVEQYKNTSMYYFVRDQARAARNLDIEEEFKTAKPILSKPKKKSISNEQLIQKPRFGVGTVPLEKYVPTALGSTAPTIHLFGAAKQSEPHPDEQAIQAEFQRQQIYKKHGVHVDS